MSQNFLTQFPSTSWPRRSFLQLAGLVLSAPAWAYGAHTEQAAPLRADTVPAKPTLDESFPTQPPSLAREMVTVSHFDLKRTRQLVEARPSLARAAWDWGFGDWETALGAASHMGNRPIAEYLISNGARPSLFSSAMLGHLEVIKAFVAAQPGVQRIRGPHSISLLAHAKAGGEDARHVFEFLQSLGDAGADAPAALAQADLDAILGAYPFGSAENELIELTSEKGSVTWTRKGTMGRPAVSPGRTRFLSMGSIRGAHPLHQRRW